VLSSQLEDMLFRIRFAALEPVTNSLLHNSLILYSEPIKTVSKPDQINKKKTGQKRKNPTEKIYEMMGEMGSDIKQLLQLVSSNSDSASLPKKVLGKRKREELIIEDEKPAKKMKEETVEDKLTNAVTSLQKLNSSERISSVRNFVRSVAPQALGQLSDLVQLLQVEIQAAHLPNNAMIVSEDTRVTPQRPAGSEIVFHDQSANGFPFSLSEFGIENTEQLDALFYDCLNTEAK
jgi:hypothetical protein